MYYIYLAIYQTKPINIMKNEEILQFDREHIWHPYTSMIDPMKVYEVESAEGVYINLASGEKLIDGMSSWWSVVQGYNNPRLNSAIERQLKKMSHVMFGGLTHRPAVELAEKLVQMTPEGLNKIFYSDSGSVSVEVAIKMALQYHHARGNRFKTVVGTFAGGYHGDTWHCMSVCDPIGGMHTMYNGRLAEQLFVPRPEVGFGQKWDNTSLENLEDCFDKHHKKMAAFIVEPIVQGAGGMYMYHLNYLKALRALCNKYDVLLIVDEIATGFGRTGKMFACEHAGIVPDIMCLGKALTAGYMSFAATMTTDIVANTISSKEPTCFMHGPTFMGNPLACSVALEHLTMLEECSPLPRVAEIETILMAQLEKARELPQVAEVRVLGAIGVVEMKNNVDMQKMQAEFVEQGVWIRPFGKLVYIMPQYVISDQELTQLCESMVTVIGQQ